MLAQCIHEYDTQKNEGINTCVAKYAPKNKTYCKSISLETRVKVAAGIYIVGYHFLWTEVMKELQMDISPHFEAYLLQRDERKVSKFNREHTRRQKTMRKKREHEKLRKELDRRVKDVAKNLEYSSMVGCNINKSLPPATKKKAVPVVCNHASYGCIATQKHKIERSKWCTFNGRTVEYIRTAKATYEKRTGCQGNDTRMASVLLLLFMFYAVRL